LSFKFTNPALRRRTILGASAGLAAAACGGNYFARAQDAGGDGLPDAADGITVSAPHVAPSLHFSDAAGRLLNLAAFRGAGLVVNIWATWCGPCVAEFPTLAAAAPALAPAKILVLPISIDQEGLKAVKPFYERHGISTLPILLDPEGTTMDALNSNGVPLTIIINQAGLLVGRAEGAANWNTGRTLALVRRLAGAPPVQVQKGFQPV
jgi:thiol-disulfide isomerase/thioredoxin